MKAIDNRNRIINFVNITRTLNQLPTNLGIATKLN